MENLEARIGGEDIHPPSSIRKVALASFIGSTVEWYDFFVYGTAAALVFGQLFFPTASPLIGTLSAFATFGVGFLFRPLGGAFFGHFGDKVGRKSMLVITLLVMGTATSWPRRRSRGTSLRLTPWSARSWLRRGSSKGRRATARGRSSGPALSRPVCDDP